jgi:lipopolysaccharide/colanic/teichoic acid biosynthesis glycosyltransferase
VGKAILTARLHSVGEVQFERTIGMFRWRISRSQIIAAVLLPPILVLLAVLYCIVLPLQGRPFLYRSERMRDPHRAFMLLKIRTMTPAEGVREMALGGHQHGRITRVGHVLRRTRLDELPQIFNVLRGEIGFIGPRPPLRRHVAACPKRYHMVLSATRPGITGLSTVMVHRREERLLSGCRTAAETEAVYLARCLPIKLRLDLLYAQRRGPLLDLVILWRTFARLSAFGPLTRRPSMPAQKTTQIPAHRVAPI